ncbi:hypothetical protein ACWGJ9_09365 [Curtobacterium citreum]
MGTKHKAQDGDLAIGSTVVDFRGLRWTRFMYRGQSDWISDTGTLSQHLPFGRDVMTVEKSITGRDARRGFAATPVLGPNSVGFGIAGEADVRPGDTIFTRGFNSAELKNVVSVERKSIRKRGVVREVTVATDKRALTHILSEANYVARGLGDDIDSYTA